LAWATLLALQLFPAVAWPLTPGLETPPVASADTGTDNQPVAGNKKGSFPPRPPAEFDHWVLALYWPPPNVDPRWPARSGLAGKLQLSSWAVAAGTFRPSRRMMMQGHVQPAAQVTWFRRWRRARALISSGRATTGFWTHGLWPPQGSDPRAVAGSGWRAPGGDLAIGPGVLQMTEKAALFLCCN
jgi:hypothetical protein